MCAIGNAFGLDGTIACGVVSAAGRSDVGFNAIEDFIQTDAAVNPGMSGGALVDERGRLVGVLSAIFAKQSDANIGVNFAVSARLASVVAERLIGEGLYRPAAAGMSLRQAPDEGEPGRTGARVVAVVDGGAAALAGVRTGDTIVSAAGRRVHGPGDFRAVLAVAREGERLTLGIERDGEPMTLNMLIE